MSVQLFQLIRFAGEAEMQMNPVERVQYYSETPTENYDGKKHFFLKISRLSKV